MEKLFSKNVKYIFACMAVVLLWTSCKKNNEGFDNPSIISGPDSAAAGTVVILEGRDLAEVRTILLENGDIPVSFNPVFNNRNAIVFRVPDTAWGGPTHILLTNEIGKTVSHPIVIVTPPIIESASLTDFVAGTQIVLKGNNLESVTDVDLVDLSDEPIGLAAEIVSTSKTEMVVNMPSTNVPRVKLQITNSSFTIVSSLNFVNITIATPIFLDGYAPSVENWSWGSGHSFAVTQEEVLMGTSSLRIITGSGSSALRFVNQGTIPFGNHTNVSFWIKGADVPTNFNFCLGKNAGEHVAWQSFSIPANEWTYVTFPLQIWRAEGMNSAWSLVFELRTADKTVYLDNFVFN